MKQVIWLAVAAVCVVRSADASCKKVDTQTIAREIHTCTPVDTSKVKADGKSYEGVMLELLGPPPADESTITKAWVPASQKLTCVELKPHVMIHAKLDHACCDGDPNAPCQLGTSQVLTNVTIDKPRPAKLMTKPELEAEVERLRIENAKLRTELDAIRAQRQAEVDRLQNQNEKLDRVLK